MCFKGRTEAVLWQCLLTILTTDGAASAWAISWLQQTINKSIFSFSDDWQRFDRWWWWLLGKVLRLSYITTHYSSAVRWISLAVNQQHRPEHTTWRYGVTFTVITLICDLSNEPFLPTDNDSTKCDNSYWTVLWYRLRKFVKSDMKEQRVKAFQLTDCPVYITQWNINAQQYTHR